MPYIDRIIQYMQSQGGDSILLVSDRECVMHHPSGGNTAVPQRLSHAQIHGMLTEILPEDQREGYASGEALGFLYTAGDDTFTVDVRHENGSLRVAIVARDGAAVSLPTLDAWPARRRPGHMDELFRLLQQLEASDLHLSSNEVPMVRIHGVMKKLDQYDVSEPNALKRLLWEITPTRNQEEWESDHDSDFAYELEGVARFRCNIFADRHGIGAVFRLIPTKIVTVKELNLPPAVVDLCFLSKGLVVVTGPTGSGKSTTLASLVDHVNKHREDHIITIEDPVEFVHNNINCLINQREVHVHTNSFSRALRAALREDPDICLVGEMRDLETVAIAIETAETGHLVFGTLHTTTAASTVDRIIDQFPADQQEQIRVMLSETLKAVIAQTLCRTKEGRRVAAWEILLIDPASANLIREGKTYQLPSMMQIGKGRGCVTMNDSLFEHVKAGRVDPKEAYIKSVDKTGMLQHFEKAGIHLNLSQAEA